MRLGPVFLTFALLAAPATAASFDCNKASSPFELAVCADSTLSKADEDMAEAFYAARGVLSKQASAVVLADQRGWIRFVKRACTDNAEPKTRGRYDADGIACLTNYFARRAETLGKIGTNNGLTTYPVEMFATHADPDPDSWNKVATTEISYAQIDDSGPEAFAFNAYARSLALPALQQSESDNEPGTSDSQFAVELRVVIPQMIGVVINDWYYGHGAAHGNYAITYGQFLRKLQRPVTASDVFAADDWALALKPLVIARLKKSLEAETGETDILWEDELDGVEKVIADPTRWDVTEEGIGFQFEPYEVTAYAFGAPKAAMRWDELSPWLQPGAMALLIGE